jgi:leader peptidase (prepilin peptidase)/N-methyltransferase
MKISWQYPVVEIITALIFLALFFKYGKPAHMDLYAISLGLMLFLIPISFIDIRKRLILNRLTIPGFILGTFLLFGFHYESWKYILFRHLFLGAFVSGLILLLIGLLGKVLFRKESLGMGDVKLLVMIGLYVGFPGVLLCLFLGILAASLFVIWGIIFRKLRFGSTIPFGPFIAIGALVHLLCGDAIISWYAGLIGLAEMGWWGLGGLK